MNDLRKWIRLVESQAAITAYHGSDTRAIKDFKHRESSRTVLFTQFPVKTQGFYFAFTPEEACEYGRYVSQYKITLNKPLFDGHAFSPQKIKDLHLILEALFKPEDDGWMVFNGLNQDHHLQTDPAQRDPDWIQDFIGAERITQGRDLIRGREGLDWEVLDQSECVQKMRQLGYDGTMVYEPKMTSKLSWFVLNSKQIKFVREVS